MKQKAFIRITIVALMMGISTGNALAFSGHFSSGDQKITLLELYTSEGCSSCPPADRWLSKLKSETGLWTRFVPVAFHVDYWDYIGWQDRFASPEYSQRQRRYAQEAGLRVVYTPGFVSNGKEWLGWRRDEDVAVDHTQAGDLSIDINGQKVAARFESDMARDEPLYINIAILGMQLSTRVHAGENNGRKLHHDFVVLGMLKEPMQADNTNHIAQLNLPEFDENMANLAIAAWVSSSRQQAPIQAVGGYLSND